VRSGGPEKLPTAENRSGCRVAYMSAPLPPIDTPAIERPARLSSVLKLASIHGTSWPMWKSSQSGANPPRVPPVQLVYWPVLPASGMTTIPRKGWPGVASVGSGSMPCSKMGLASMVGRGPVCGVVHPE
jgi:hypothetical protein